MPAIRLSVAARSDVGRVRSKNEDAFTVADLDTGLRLDDQGALTGIDVRERGVLMVVSDGMGGHAAGEVASALVVDSLRATLGESSHDESMDRLMEKAVQRANQDVFEAARDASKRGMGATLTAVLVHQRQAYIAEVGDSRAYLWRKGRIRQMTKDQSFVQLLLDSGAITSEQAESFGNRNWIAQAMGLETNVHVAIGKLDLRRGDRLLVCCDGLYNLVSDDELGEFLAQDDLWTTCNRMIDLANERGGSDNVTAVVARFDGEGLPDAPHNETVTQTFEVLQEFAGLRIKDPSRAEEDEEDEYEVEVENSNEKEAEEDLESRRAPTVKPPPPKTMPKTSQTPLVWWLVPLVVFAVLAVLWLVFRL